MADPWLDHLRIDYDEERRWIVMHRGALAIACNLGPIRSRCRSQVKWCWPGVSRRLGQNDRLPGHSFAILRTVK